jgi:predicted alpha-1,2-mannosidase
MLSSLFSIISTAFASSSAVVDPFIGTQGTGHTFPGAILPFGRVQLSPDAGKNGWMYCSGYQHGDIISRASHIHLSGTGAGDGYDIGWEFAPFKPTKETASPGYYSAHGSAGQHLELTVSDNCGLIRYRNLDPKLGLNSIFNWDRIIEVKHEGTSGYRRSQGWSTNTVYFNYTLQPGLITTCISHEAIPPAENLNFDEVKARAASEWKPYLDKIKTSNVMLSTALYHTLVHPSKYTSQQPYSVFSTWDTYRAWNPLMTWLYPEMAEPWTRSMTVKEFCPIWEIWGTDSQMMTGTHSISMIGEYVLKGLIPVEQVWAKLDRSLYRPDRYYDEYYSRGYISAESSRVATSMALEHAYTDWVLLEITKKFNVTSSRPLNPWSYRKYFDDDMFYRRLRNGLFDKNEFNRIDRGFGEGSAWSYQWSVLHDFRGLVRLHNPEDAQYCSQTLPCTRKIEGTIKQRLDTWFGTPGICGQMQDLTNCIGQYAHSNEPNHHVIFLYSVLGHPDVACRHLRYVVKNFYSDRPNGIPGNDDAGQTSAWLLYAALGFYPVNPASGVYIMACPAFDEPLTVGKLSVTTSGSGYNPSYTFRGQKYDKLYITHADLLEGGHLHVTLS